MRYSEKCYWPVVVEKWAWAWTSECWLAHLQKSEGDWRLRRHGCTGGQETCRRPVWGLSGESLVS